MLDYLLEDKTTTENIFFATELYEDFDFETHITKEIILSNENLIIPRVLKSKDTQDKRKRKNAEVFTPSWLCNKMNNYIDEDWFGIKDVFNIEDGKEWTPTKEKIQFPESKNWGEYVKSTRLEIACGEAPYLVSRYDAATGELIPVEKRIGLLDRKLRIVGENTNTLEDWIKWSFEAYKSVYGYEYQGDNLLIARANLLLTFCEYAKHQWNYTPDKKILIYLASVISENLWQMDGLTDTIPYKDIKKIEEPIYCTISDWTNSEPIRFKSLKEVI